MHQTAARLARYSIGLFFGMLIAPAFAHPGIHLTEASFSAGIAHPLLGWDHVLAMIAVGLWVTQQRGKPVWILPAVFPLAMALGMAAGMNSLVLPTMEMGIAASVLLLGLFVAFALRPPLWAGAVMVSMFGVLHGAAHGTELPAGSAPGLYAAGVVIATLALHAGGIAAGFAAKRHGVARFRLERFAGACTAVAGMAMVGGLA